MLRGHYGDHTAATAARAYVLLHADAVARAPVPGKAHVLLARCALAYARAHRYRDRGENRAGREAIHFITAFDRSTGDFRFEFKSRSWGTRWNRYVVWRRNGATKRWWTIDPQVDTGSSLAIGLAGATGISSGVAHFVPRLLLPDEVGGRAITNATGLQLLPDDVHEGRRCYRVGTAGDGTYWIDAETWLLRRIEALGGGVFYSPELDAPIEDHWFEFDPAQLSKGPLP